MLLLWAKLLSGIIFVLIPGFSLKENYKKHPFLSSLSLMLGFFLLFLSIQPLINKASDVDLLKDRLERIENLRVKKENSETKSETKKATTKVTLDKTEPKVPPSVNNNEVSLIQYDPMSAATGTGKFYKANGYIANEKGSELKKLSDKTWRYRGCTINLKGKLGNELILKSHDSNFIVYKDIIGNSSKVRILDLNNCKTTFLKGKGIADSAIGLYIDMNDDYVFISNEYQNIGVYSKAKKWNLIKILGKWKNNSINFILEQSPDRRYLVYSFPDTWGLYDLENNKVIKKISDVEGQPKSYDTRSWGSGIKNIKFIEGKPEILLEVNMTDKSKNTSIKKYIYNFISKSYKKISN